MGNDLKPNRESRSDGKRNGKQGPLCMWHGLGFGTWLNLLFVRRPPLGWCRAGRILSVTAFTLSNSVWAFLEWLLLGVWVRRTKIENPPVFIIGHWRSGTTLVHNLMSKDPQFSYPTTYECVFPSHFLLTEGFVTKITAPLVPEKRPMDNIKAGWDQPQEDEIALCILTLCSPYLLLTFQGDRSAYEPYFDLKGVSKSELRRWKKAFVWFLKKLTWKHGRTILLKSPSHSFRVKLLSEMFPGARFIYLTRDPYVVFDSTLHLRRVLHKENTLAAPHFEGMEEEVFRIYERLFETYEAEKSCLPDGRLSEVRFEDLELDPIAEMQRIYQELGLEGFEAVRPTLVEYMASLEGYRKNPHEIDPELRQEIYARWKPAFERYGYPSHLEATSSHAS